MAKLTGKTTVNLKHITIHILNVKFYIKLDHAALNPFHEAINNVFIISLSQLSHTCSNTRFLNVQSYKIIIN